MTSSTLKRFELEFSLFWVSPTSRAIIRLLLSEGRRWVDSTDVVSKLHLPNRYRIRRALKNDGLPSFKILAAWIRLYDVVCECERSNRSMSRLALNDGRKADTYSAAARRLTGIQSAQVVSRGSIWVILELLGQCQPRTDFPTRDSLQRIRDVQ